MEDNRRRAYIKQQATTKKKQEGSLPPKVTGQTNPSTKRTPLDKVDYPPKKPKVTRPNASKTLAKLPPKPGPGVEKGLIKGPVPVAEERPVLFREDSSYSLKQLSSIIKEDDYSDLGNHATEAMGETDLFILAQLCLSVTVPCSILLLSCSKPCFCFLQGVVMMKGLIDRCVSHEMVLGRLREKLGAKETEMQELLAWKDV